MLKSIEKVIKTLEERDITYCHWKSNEHLAEALNGDTDLDVLFDPTQRVQLEMVLDACQKGEDAIKSVIRLNDIYGRIYTQSASKSIMKNLIKKIIRLLIPISQKKMYSIIENKIKRIPSGGYWANLYGHWEEKEIVPKDWYGEGKYYTFESIKLCGIENDNSYLTQLYGDYIKLPPEKNRIPHGDKAYKL